jgi:hypothetical protein
LPGWAAVIGTLVRIALHHYPRSLIYHPGSMDAFGEF